MTRVGALIPIRLQSSRLPDKALALIGGRPAVHHLLDRCFASRHVDSDLVIVCTTTDASDDRLVEAVHQAGAKVFRGARDDLVERLWGAACEHRLDLIAQVDGDDVCTDTRYMDMCLEKALGDPAIDVVVAEGLPLGTSTRVVRRTAFGHVIDLYTPGKNDTGFMYYFTRSGLFRVETVTPDDPGDVDDTLRLTLDYEEDLAFFRAIFGRLFEPGRVFGIRDIVALVTREPTLRSINAGLDERYWARTRELVDEEALEILRPEGRFRIEG